MSRPPHSVHMGAGDCLPLHGLRKVREGGPLPGAVAPVSDCLPLPAPRVVRASARDVDGTVRAAPVAEGAGEDEGRRMIRSFFLPGRGPARARNDNGAAP